MTSAGPSEQRYADPPQRERVAARSAATTSRPALLPLLSQKVLVDVNIDELARITYLTPDIRLTPHQKELMAVICNELWRRATG